MNAKSRAAKWLLPRLVDYTPKGAARPPGGVAGTVLVQDDGTELALVSNGDSADLYINDKKTVVAFSLSAKTLLALARWIVWSWFVKATLFGAKTWLWQWCLKHLQKTNEKH